MAAADIEFGGVRKRCQMACVPEAQEGDYVLVHAGVALTIIDRAEAQRMLSTLNELTSPPLESRSASSGPLHGGEKETA